MIVLPVWKELLQWGPLLLGGAAMGSTVERVLGPCRSWPRRGALYLLLAWLAGPETAEWGCRCVGLSTALAAASGTVCLMWRTGGSIWLLPAAAGLLAAAWKAMRHGGTG